MYHILPYKKQIGYKMELGPIKNSQILDWNRPNTCYLDYSEADRNKDAWKLLVRIYSLYGEK